MTKEKAKAKALMILFFALFFISFLSFLSLILIAIVIFFTPIECLDSLGAFVYGFWGFLGCVFSFIFAFFGIIYENKYIGKENYYVTLHKIRKNCLMTLCGLLVLVGAGVGVYSNNRVHSYLEKTTYTREIWLSGNEDRRGEIVSSFLKEYDLLSFTKEQVEYYLGTADRVVENRYTYNLGYGMPCSTIEPSILEIQFSSSSQVTDYHIWDS